MITSSCSTTRRILSDMQILCRSCKENDEGKKVLIGKVGTGAVELWGGVEIKRENENGERREREKKGF